MNDLNEVWRDSAAFRLCCSLIAAASLTLFIHEAMPTPEKILKNETDEMIEKGKETVYDLLDRFRSPGK